MDKLDLIAIPALHHVSFGIFNLALSDIAFWVAVIIVFVLAAWARIPQVMESDTASRNRRPDA